MGPGQVESISAATWWQKLELCPAIDIAFIMQYFFSKN